LNRAAVLTFLGSLAIAACSLGLDESKIATALENEAGSDFADPPSTVDGADASVPGRDGSLPDAGECHSDQDCKAPAACLTGRCDTASHTCFYDVCKQAAACKRMQCVGQTQCGNLADVRFESGTFPVKNALACGGDPTRCVAAVYPFLFVGVRSDSTSGMAAYSLADPNPDPTSFLQIPVTGVEFFPDWVIASGRRIYAIESPVKVNGDMPPSKARIAWIDVPRNPFAPLVAQTSLVTLSDVTRTDWVFPAPGDSVFLVASDDATHYPTAIAQLLTEPVTLASAHNNGSVGRPIAASGDRLVTYSFDNGHTFGLETAAGTTSSAFAGKSGALGIAAGGGESVFPVRTNGQTSLPGSIAIGPNGALAWGVSVTDGFSFSCCDTCCVRGCFICNCRTCAISPTHYARVSRILPNGNGAVSAFDTDVQANVETYPQSPASTARDVMGPMAFLNADNLLVAVKSAGDENKTHVRVVTFYPKQPPDAGADAGPETSVSQAITLPCPIERVALVTANGFGYALAIDSPANTSATVHIIAPSCVP